MGKMTTASKNAENQQQEPYLTVVPGEDTASPSLTELEAALSWPKLNLSACPLGIEGQKDKVQQVGPYNPSALAGRAMSLTAALSPDYMNAYLSGLDDLAQLNGIAHRE